MIFRFFEKGALLFCLVNHGFIQLFKSPHHKVKSPILFSTPMARIITLVTPSLFFSHFLSLNELKQYDMQLIEESFFLQYNYDNVDRNSLFIHNERLCERKKGLQTKTKSPHHQP